MNIISKLPKVGRSIFSIMTQLANEHQAVNLSQGFPDFETSPELIDLVYRKMNAGHNQYAPMEGVLRLRELIAEKNEKLHGYYYHPETDITITAGATQAISTVITTIIRPGEEVIIIEPAYDSYTPIVKAMGGIVKTLELSPTNNYRIDWFVLRRLINSQTKLIIINTPNNPSATLFEESDMQEFIRAVEGSDILILSDEVYEHIIFDGYKHNSVIKYPELRDRSFVVASFGKLFHTTGWKLGYCLAPKKLMEEFRKLHQFQVFSVNTPMQHAIADYMQDEESYTQLGDFFEKKRNMFFKLMEGTRFKLLPCKGTYFALAQYDTISDETELEFAKRLVKDYGVASIPLSSFYSQDIDNKVIRFCFAKKEATLEQATKRLRKV